MVLEVTQRCNLNYPFSFADAKSDGRIDPSLKEIQVWCQTLLSNGGPYNIQLSGGEPALRDDLSGDRPDDTGMRLQFRATEYQRRSTRPGP